MQLNMIRERLMYADESKWAMISSVQLRDPMMMLVVSLLGGGLGIDRFMIGQTGAGIAKLITCGELGIWSLVDLFLIQKATRQTNFEKLQPYLM
jgi:TM2 domain-containing membrane protein YozV